MSIGGKVIEMSTKIGIIGAGYIGCFVGANLIKAGADVTFLGRVRFGSVIRQHGLSVDSAFKIPASEVQWVTEPSELPKLDVVIFTTKSQDTLKAGEEVAPFVDAGALIISLQNGVRNKAILREVFPSHQILSGMVPYNVVAVAEGATFKQTTKGHIYLEDCDDERMKLFKKPHFQLVNNIEEIQYGKLLRNLNNALNALSDRPLLVQLSDGRERRLLSKVVEEGLISMKANGIRPKNTSAIPIEILPKVLLLPNFLFQLILKKEVAADPSARLSMWNDLETGRKTEIDYLNGEVVSLAKEAGHSAPYNQEIVDLVKLAESGDVAGARAKYQEMLER